MAFSLADLISKTIQNALNTDTPIEEVLLGAAAIAQIVDDEDFKTWVEHELHGYAPGVEVPPYRDVGFELKADLRYWIGAGLKTERGRMLPASAFFEGVKSEYRNEWSAGCFYAGLSALRDLRANDEAIYAIPIPLEIAIPAIQRLFNREVDVLYAYKEISKPSIAKVESMVRERLNAFLVKYARAANLELEFLKKPEVPPQAMGNIFNTTINAPVTSLAIGNEASSTVNQVTQGDMDSLMRALQALGVTGQPFATITDGISELEAVREPSGSQTEKSAWKARVWAWVKNLPQALAPLVIGEPIAAIATKCALKYLLGSEAESELEIDTGE